MFLVPGFPSLRCQTPSMWSLDIWLNDIIIAPTVLEHTQRLALCVLVTAFGSSVFVHLCCVLFISDLPALLLSVAISLKSRSISVTSLLPSCHSSPVFLQIRNKHIDQSLYGLYKTGVVNTISLLQGTRFLSCLTPCSRYQLVFVKHSICFQTSCSHLAAMDMVSTDLVESSNCFERFYTHFNIIVHELLTCTSHQSCFLGYSNHLGWLYTHFSTVASNLPLDTIRMNIALHPHLLSVDSWSVPSPQCF